MDDRTHPSHDNAPPPDRSAPSVPRSDKNSRGNGPRDSSGDERASADRSSSAKPALTDRERSERWPVD